MNETRILYINDNSEMEQNFIHIYGVQIVNDYLNVRVYSDCEMLEMYLNGRLCSRQKGKEVFDFYEPCSEIGGSVEIRIAATRTPGLSQTISFEILDK